MIIGSLGISTSMPARTERMNSAQLRSGLFKAFGEALTVYTKEAMPDRWPDVMSQHGIILLALGEQVTGKVTLEMAVKKLRKVLKVRKRQKAPQIRAQTANNLRAACCSQAKQNATVAFLHKAQKYLKSAAKVYQEIGDAKCAEIIRSNRARVEHFMTAGASVK